MWIVFLWMESEGELSMAASSVVAFWAVALLLIVVPGADWAFVLSSGLRARSVVPAVGGLALGYAGIAVIVAAGVGVLLARSPAVLGWLTLVGGCYLIWHGARTFTGSAAPGPPAAGSGSPAAGSGSPAAGSGSPAVGSGSPAVAPAGRSREVLVKGMGVSALNPKGLLMFLALLPQFTNPRWAWPLAAQLGLLGAVFVVTCAAFYLGLGSAARKILRARPAAARAVTRCSGLGMIAVGAALLVEHFVA
jgi:threonine/homoserine/homoserine lactone efflux protein